MVKKLFAIPLAVMLVGMYIGASNVPVPEESKKVVQETIEKDLQNNKTKEDEQVEKEETKEVKVEAKKENNVDIKKDEQHVSNTSDKTVKKDTSSSTTANTAEEAKPGSPIQNDTSNNSKPTQTETKKEEKPIIYHYETGNSGKLYSTENEAINEAEKEFNNFDNPDKYISSYSVYSTYDKWTIEYYYTNW